MTLVNTLLIIAPCFFAISILFSMLGLGGGALYTPIQLFFGIDFHHAATNSLLLILMASLSAISIYARNKKIDWPLAGILLIASTAGAFTGGFISEWLSEETLSLIFSLTVLCAAWPMLRDRQTQKQVQKRERKWYLWQREAEGQLYYVNIVLATPIFLAAGLLSALLGIGGGVFNVPIIVLFFGAPMDIAVGTSVVMVAATASSGLIGHTAQGHLDLSLALPLSLITFIGAQIGARTAIKMDRSVLRNIFGIVLIIIALAVIGRETLFPASIMS